ncbi:MAG: hypothetical protein ACYDBJ_14305 [Aggregatilineales bacterium]
MKQVTVYTLIILAFLTLTIFVEVLLAVHLAQRDNEAIERYCLVVNNHVDNNSCYLTLGHSSL